MIHTVIVKVASVCNIKCDYCYVSRKNELYNNARILSSDLVHKLIKDVASYCEKNEIKEFSFCWHGGEPLLAGKEFYSEIVQLQNKYFSKSVRIDNYIQTNGILLNEDWIELFKRYNFILAISLDGPDYIHDIRRKTKGGRGTHVIVERKVQLLRKCNYPVRILAVIIPEALSYGKELYSYFRSIDCKWMDFLYPMCNWIDNTFDTEVEPKALAKFLCEVFDEWVKEDNPEVYIRLYHDWCMLLMKGNPVACHSRTDCSYVITLNSDGNIYICDDLISYTESKLGHLSENDITGIEQNPTLKRLSDMENLFSNDCLNCSFFPVCRGGCTVFRVKEKGNFLAKNYFCQTQKLVISHIKRTIVNQLN